MSKCDNCCIRKECATAFDIHWLGKDDCPYDKCPFQTNADRIRAMTDEELADEILRWFNWLNAVEWDDKRIINWLKQEADE